MASADQTLVVLPRCERDPDTLDAALRHAALVKQARRVKHLGAKGRPQSPNFELIGDKASKDKGNDDDDEVDDSFFTLDDEHRARVRLTIANVPRRAGTRIKRTLRGGKGRKDAPGIVIEEVDDDDDDAGSHLEDTGGRRDGAMNAPASVNGVSDMRASPSISQESVVSLELPAFAPLTAPSSRASPAFPAFPHLSAFPTLYALRTTTSTASSTAQGSSFTPDPPSRRLTIDEGMAPVSRRDTRSSLQHAANKRGFHLPGRHYFSRHGKATAAADAAAASEPVADPVTHALQEAGMYASEEDRVVVDVLYEHQRGLVVFGLPKFSSNALFQVDPPRWCDDELKPSPFTPHTYPLPPYWAWRDSEFMVDMGGDKDEEGWSYALRFRSRFWRGEAYTTRSFVRRRRWIRTRVYRPDQVPPLAASGAQSQLETTDGTSTPEERAPAPPAPEYDPSPPRGITDLHSACAALPLPAPQRSALLLESSSPLSYAPGGPITRTNPFVSYRSLKLQAASSAALPPDERASAHEPRWRDAVRELNLRRAMGVLRAHAKVDRQRLALWRRWLGAGAAPSSAAPSVRAGVGAGQRSGSEGARYAVRLEAAEGAGTGAGEAGQRAVSAAAAVAEEKERTEVWDDVVGTGDSGPDADDVWDVVEGRLDQILGSFDYHFTRFLFLELILSQHPLHDASHRFAGYDVSEGAQRDRLERGLEDRLSFFNGVKDLVAHYGAQGGWLRAKADVAVGASLEEDGAKEEAQARNGRDKGNGKGKRRAD